VARRRQKNSKPAKKPRKVASGQKEMLMQIAGKKPAKEADPKKPACPERNESRLKPRHLWSAPAANVSE
jgi:hypothetical protein